MVAYLRTAALERPTVLAGESTSVSDELGSIRAPFARGEVFLRGPEKRVLRLVWNGSEDAGARQLEPGRYDVLGYRVVKQVGHDTWHLSVSSKSIRTLKVETGKETRLRLRASVQMKKHLWKSRVGVAIWGEDKQGLTLYKNAVRIPIGFRTLDAGGEVLESGAIEYG